MNENINLYEVLKGHEDEIFYNPYWGNIKYSHISNSTMVFYNEYGSYDNRLITDFEGKSFHTNELCIFP